MRTSRRIATGALATVAALTLSAGPALAHECINPNKQAVAGAQIVFGETEILYISKGLQNRIDQGLVDLDSGEGFSGLIGFDMDGDGVGDLTTWIVGPTGEIPESAQYNGAACYGVINIDDWFEECMPA